MFIIIINFFLIPINSNFSFFSFSFLVKNKQTKKKSYFKMLL